MEKIKVEDQTTREKIFFSALFLFAEKGYRGTTVRDICRKAGAANINSINYYFGGKEKLYRYILEYMYSEFSRRKPDYPDNIPPEQHLKDFIFSYCEMQYTDNEYTRAFIAISNSEMTNPSPWMKALVKKYVKQQSFDFLAVMRKLLGSSVPENIVRDCALSVGGQIIYYSFAWPVVSAVFPDHPGMGKYHPVIAEHIYEFSMAGIMAVRKKYEKSGKERGHDRQA
jgi:AcrR family transcriptional regulator